MQKANLAERAERHNDMAVCMKSVTEQGAGLPDEERNLLSVTYKNVVGACTQVILEGRLRYWAKDEGAAKKQQMAQEYGGKVETKLRDIDDNVPSLLGNVLDW